MNLTVMHKGQSIDQFTANSAEEARKYVLERFGEVLTVVDNNNNVVVRPYNLELKNVKYAAFASEETHCFSATLYVNGKRFCEVSNDGHGGCDNFHGIKGGYPQNEVYRQVAEMDKAFKNEILDSEWDKDGIPNSVEIEVGNLMNQWHRVQAIKKVTRKICYIKGDDTLTVYQQPARVKPTAKNLELIKRAPWWGDDYKLLNEMSVDQILELDHFKAA